MLLLLCFPLFFRGMETQHDPVFMVCIQTQSKSDSGKATINFELVLFLQLQTDSPTPIRWTAIVWYLKFPLTIGWKDLLA